MRWVIAVVLVSGGSVPLAAQAPVQCSPVAFDALQLAPRRDSLRVLIQGNPAGAQVIEIRHQGDTLLFIERTTIPLLDLEQETRVVMDRMTLVPLAIDQTGRAGPQLAETHLSVVEGRMRGRARTPQPGSEPRVTDVDTLLADGTLDVNQVQAAVSALPLAVGVTYTLSVFNAADGSIKPYTVRVEALESVTVPAGAFAVFRLAVSGGALPTVMLVSSDTPRRVVKVEVVGQPIVFELVT
jgi:hypothetical protein